MQAATVVINRRALRHNLQRLRELAPASKLVAVVKANAYGHGLLETAQRSPMPTLLALPVSKKLSACAPVELRNPSAARRLF
ncbi:alanine racemase [Shigella flexneri]